MHTGVPGCASNIDWGAPELSNFGRADSMETGLRFWGRKAAPTAWAGGSHKGALGIHNKKGGPTGLGSHRLCFGIQKLGLILGPHVWTKTIPACLAHLFSHGAAFSPLGRLGSLRIMWLWQRARHLRKSPDPGQVAFSASCGLGATWPLNG